MAVETFYFPIGLTGTTMYYKEIKVVVPNESIMNSEVVTKNFNRISSSQSPKLQKKKFLNKFNPRKESKNYEGNKEKKFV